MIACKHARSIAGSLTAAALMTAIASPAMAHVGDHAHSTFFTGFLHPLGGLDHLAAMIAVGLWAAIVGGQRIWIWPTAFVGAMVIGGILGHSGIDLPMVEPAIAASVIVLGVAILAVSKAPTAAGVALIAVFGAFHGHAHGAEAPEGSWLGYAAGFVIATVMLHGIGLGAGQFLQTGAALKAARVIGGATAALGLVLLLQ